MSELHIRCGGLTPEKLAEVSGWQEVSDLQKVCLVRDMFDEKEHKEHDPLLPIEEEDNSAKNATLESKLWTLDEVNWRETTRGTTTIEYVPVQVRPMVARLRERVAKVATEENGPQQVRAWKFFLSLDKMLFQTFPRTANGPTILALPRQSGPVLRRSRPETYSKSSDNPTNVRPLQDHETKCGPHGPKSQGQTPPTSKLP